MTDTKETIINNVVMKMCLDKETSNKLKNILNIELYNYSVMETQETEVAIRDETFNEKILRLFIVAKTVQGCTSKTIGYYTSVIRGFADFVNKQYNEITANDVRFFLAVKKERDKNSDGNIDNIRRVLSSFFNWMCDEEYISKSPINKIKKVRVEKRVKKPFKDMEMEKLRFGAKDDARMTAILEVMLSTGCRVGEIEKMNRSDLDGDEIVVYGKGKKERIVYLNAKARFALQKYMESRKDDNPAMFVSRFEPHERLMVSGIEMRIRKLGRENGVEDTHPHRFRRTAATLAINRGMPIEQVQIMLGHESIETTTIYAVSAQETVKTSHKKYLG